MPDDGPSAADIAKWSEIQPTEPVQQRADRLLALHLLISVDAFHLASALIWAQESPPGA